MLKSLIQSDLKLKWSYIDSYQVFLFCHWIRNFSPWEHVSQKCLLSFSSHLCRSCSWRQHQQHVFADTRDGGWATEKSSMGPTTQCLVELVFFPWVKRQTIIIIIIVACSFATGILLKWTSIWKLCALDFELVYVIGNKTLWTWFQLWQKLKEDAQVAT